MSTHDATVTMTGDEIIALSKKHTIFEWSAQNAADPIPVARAKGAYFWTPEGKRFLDFNSQLMCVNIGHGDERVVRAIQEQAAMLAYANPFMATEPRARLGAKLAEITPGDIDVFFFTNGGAEANENAIKIARWYTGRHKILRALSLVSRRHGRRDHADRRSARWAAEPGMPGVVHFPIRTTASSAAGTSTEDALRDARGNHRARGAADDRGDHPRAGHGHQRRADPAGRLSAGRSRALRRSTAFC